MRGRFDAGQVEFAQAGDVADDAFEVLPELRKLLLRKLQTGQRRHVFDIDAGIFHDGGPDYLLCSSIRVLVTRSQTSDGPKYWIGPG